MSQLIGISNGTNFETEISHRLDINKPQLKFLRLCKTKNHINILYKPVQI
jgi:hypothetical protein